MMADGAGIVPGVIGVRITGVSIVGTGSAAGIAINKASLIVDASF